MEIWSLCVTAYCELDRNSQVLAGPGRTTPIAPTRAAYARLIAAIDARRAERFKQAEVIRALIAAVVVVGVVALRVPWMILALTLVAASLMGYRWYVGTMVRHRARAALRWLQLHAKTIEPAD
jgi:hypothetical protein